jgi:PII-like signaling protein
MPVVTVIIDAPERIARTFDIVNDVTAEHGLVTSEIIPAAVSVDGTDRDGGTGLAGYSY